VVNAVKSWEILSESRDKDSLYEVKIRSTNSKASIYKELSSMQILIESMNKPRVLVMISEDNCGNRENNNSTAENAIHTYLKDPFKFDLINPAIATSIKSSPQRTQQLINDLATAVATGTQNNAEVLIVGSATSKVSENNAQNKAGMITVEADVTLKAINCTTGRLINVTRSQASTAELSHLSAGNSAIEKAAISGVKELIDPILKDWQGQLSIGISININIKEVKNYRQKNIILQTFDRMSNISSVREEFWDPENFTLDLTIYYKGSPNDLFRKIDGYKLISGGGSLLLTGVSNQKANLVVQAM